MSIQSQTVELLTFAVTQNANLSKKIKPLADEILSSPDPSIAMDQVFQAARGESIAAKISNARDRARAIGKAWNRLADGLNGHASSANMVFSWPNFASGKGECTCQTAEVSKAAKKAAKQEREEADARALEAFQAERAASEAAALASMGASDLADSIAAMIAQWSQDRAQQHLVLSNVADALGLASLSTSILVEGQKDSA
jgi:hypothetical protein